jgi:N-acetylglucosamine-6-phosphate deacetylase
MSTTGCSITGTHDPTTRDPEHPGTCLLRGWLVLENSILEDGWILVRNGRIAEIGSGPPPPADVAFDYRPGYLAPGLIDIHLHGMEDGDAGSAEGIRRMREAAPRHGVTGIVPTLASASPAGFLRFLLDGSAEAQRGVRGARLLGLHCEGPHINPVMARGMDPQCLRPPDPAEDDELLEHGRELLAIMTLSPELPGSEELIRELRQNRVVAAIGHSAATREQIRTAVRSGASHVCHMFNAFPKREREPHLPDTASYCLESPELTLELILDLVHVSADQIELARREAGIDRLVGITDGMRGAGLGGGTFRMTDGRVYRIGPRGDCRLVENGVLVGSALTLVDGLRNLAMHLGFTLSEAARVCSTNPARVLGLADRLGKIASGFEADLVALDRDLRPLATFVGGQLVWTRAHESGSTASAA